MAVSRVYSLVPLLLLLLLSITGTQADDEILTNYEFENRVPPNNTVVVSATPSGNLSTSEFGTVRVVTNILRESMAVDSPVLGSVVGLVNTLKDNSIYLTFNFVYESADWNGTLGVQGRLDAAGNGELVVNGGTGDFRYAQGFCETTLVAADDPANIVFKNVIHLKL